MISFCSSRTSPIQDSIPGQGCCNKYFIQASIFIDHTLRYLPQTIFMDTKSVKTWVGICFWSNLSIFSPWTLKIVSCSTKYKASFGSVGSKLKSNVSFHFLIRAVWFPWALIIIHFMFRKVPFQIATATHSHYHHECIVWNTKKTCHLLHLCLVQVQL